MNEKTVLGFNEGLKVDVLNVKIGDLIRDFYFRDSPSDFAAIRQIFSERIYDISKLNRYPEFLEFVRTASAGGKQPLIIDAGANIGAASVYFSCECPGSRVVAIEPDMANFELLIKNTKGLDITALRCALNSTPAPVQIIDVGLGPDAYRTVPITENAPSREIVSCVTINEVYEAHETDYFPFLVKIDIEGGERDVFAKNTEWISRTPIIIVELHDWLLPKKGTATPFLKCMAEEDRDFITGHCLHMTENVFSISNDLDSLAIDERPRG